MTRTGWIVLAAPLIAVIGWAATGGTMLAAPGDPTYIEITPAGSAVTASTNDENVPANAVDNNLGTRWSGNGDGAWLQVDLGAPHIVGRVGIAVHMGNTRRNRFDLQYATTSGMWNPIVTNVESSGTTTAEENYSFPAVNARWIRYVGHGNNVAAKASWNSVAEISVFEPQEPVPTVTPTVPPDPTPTPTIGPTVPPTATPVTPVFVELTPPGSGVSASTNDGNAPANAVDNNLDTRWSGNGNGATLTLNLGATQALSYVTIAWFSGNTRRSTFDLQVSENNTTWTNVLTGVQSSGTTNGEEMFDFPDVPAHWVRYVGHGNNAAGKTSWNSVSEISLWGTTTNPLPTPTPTPMGPTPTPTPTGTGVISLFDGTTLNGWIQVPADSWEVKNGAMASKGVGRGYIYTVNQYSHYRVMFTMRHVSGNPDHQACVLVFGTYPPPSRDALGGIQFQPPNGGHWDYRPGHNNGGGSLFTRPTTTHYNNHEWSRVEILVNAATGIARMAVAQPLGTKAVENLVFKDASAGQRGPIAWQMHNKGLFDEYKDVTLEDNPRVDDLITTK
jgi:hypothetical protein